MLAHNGSEMIKYVIRMTSVLSCCPLVYKSASILFRVRLSKQTRHRAIMRKHARRRQQKPEVHNVPQRRQRRTEHWMCFSTYKSVVPSSNKRIGRGDVHGRQALMHLE